MTLSLDRIMKAAAALALIGLCRSAYVHFVTEPAAHLFRLGPAFDAPYQPSRELLPAKGEVGYVSDLPLLLSPGLEWQAPKQRFLRAQYALAPLILRYHDDRAPQVLVDAFDPEHLDDLLQRHALEPIARLGPGLLLARPSAR
jgi:hypothetical protein